MTFTISRYKDDAKMAGKLFVLTIGIFVGLSMFITNDYWYLRIPLVTAFFGFNIWNHYRHYSKCKLTLEDTGFTVEVLRASAEIPMRTERYLWKDVERYILNHVRHPDAGLQVRFNTGETLHFTGTTAYNNFHDYLRAKFPEKEGR